MGTSDLFATARNTNPPLPRPFKGECVPLLPKVRPLVGLPDPDPESRRAAGFLLTDRMARPFETEEAVFSSDLVLLLLMKRVMGFADQDREHRIIAGLKTCCNSRLIRGLKLYYRFWTIRYLQCFLTLHVSTKVTHLQCFLTLHVSSEVAHSPIMEVKMKSASKSSDTFRRSSTCFQETLDVAIAGLPAKTRTRNSFQLGHRLLMETIICDRCAFRDLCGGREREMKRFDSSDWTFIECWKEEMSRKCYISFRKAIDGNANDHSPSGILS